jgi:colicin import membrane protein
MADDRLALLHELERADEAVGAELVELDEIHAAVEELRGRALELRNFFAELPGERRAAAAALEEAGLILDEARAAAERAAEELKRTAGEEDEEHLAEARRLDVRARDHLNIAERRAEADRERVAELYALAKVAESEAVVVEARARELAAALARRPRVAEEAVAAPAEGLDGVAEWGTQARAALLVARGQVAAERDALVRQAIEVAAVLLGETPPVTVAAVARRVEREYQ